MVIDVTTKPTGRSGYYRSTESPPKLPKSTRLQSIWPDGELYCVAHHDIGQKAHTFSRQGLPHSCRHWTYCPRLRLKPPKKDFYFWLTWGATLETPNLICNSTMNSGATSDTPKLIFTVSQAVLPRFSRKYAILSRNLADHK